MKKDKTIVKVRNYLLSRGMIEPGDRLLAAVSGGPDSVFLLYALMDLRDQIGFSLMAGHLNHCLRGAESNGDQAFVRDLAKMEGIKLVSARRDVAGYARRHKLSLETAARKLRREFLEKTADKHRCQKIATGHSLNDQAETVLMHIIRGSGLAGLKGIPAVNGKFIRPMMEVSREEITEWLESRGLAWREDASNRNPEHFRNRVRLELIPRLISFNPQIVKALSRLAQAAGDDLELLEMLTGEAAARCMKIHKTKIIIDLSLFNSYNKGLKNNLLRLAATSLAGPLAVPTSERTCKSLGFFHSARVGSRLELAPNLWAEIGYGKAEIRLGKGPALRTSQSGDSPLAIPGTTVFNGWKIKASLLKAGPGVRPEGAQPSQAYFDRRILARKNITVGRRRSGDVMDIFGSSAIKKTKELFIEAKVPLARRDAWPVIRWGREVIWLPGIKRSSLAPVGQRTREIIKLELE
jgi:tRNA(Ile)-lysidine synthase